jgi:arabinofuranan 3-O-arabinosyltransferase
MTAATKEPVVAPAPAAAAASASPEERSGGRLAPALGALLLVTVAVLQRPGQVTFDTKLDLAVDPLGFMGRALHLWNPEATSGELQNQAYGYLFPIGPFFAAGDALGVPPWITQRAWCALLLCTAYAGVLLLARALRIGSPSGRLLGALAYALAPRMLTEVGPLSSEMLPVVMLPWVLLPLVAVHRIGSPRRAAALSGLAVLCMGGINAAAVVMALVLPALYLATRRWDRHLAVLAAWWAGCVAGATLWWVAPLLLFGQYSLPFLDYIETSATTTAVTSQFQALRGTNQWVGYIVQGEPWWPAGWVLVDNPGVMAATALVAVTGLVGLGLRGLPERRFLVLGAMTGLTLLTVGYLGTLDSPFAATARDLLDGPLAPLRNVHKFEPVLRLPIVLGLAYAASQLLSLRRVRVPAAPVVACLLLAAAAPAWMFLLRPGPGWSDVPAHWRQAAGWLAAQDPSARTLVVPGQGFAQNTWGRTVDEAIQPLAGAPWSTRHQIPLGSEGNIRVMDTVEAVLAQGRGSPGLADFLARAGYRYLLVRHDIDRGATGAPPIAVVRRAVAGSPGLTPVASFGPAVGTGDAARSPVDATASAPSIEIYDVRGSANAVSATALAGVPVVSGGPESLLGLLEQGLVDGRQPVVLAGDAAGLDTAGRPWIVTDGLRRRELNVGRMRDNVSQTLTADEQTRQRRLRGDLTPFASAGHETVAAYQGIRSVDASSSAAFADTVGPSDPSHLPFAALDGDSRTSWRSDPFVAPAGQWLEVAFDTPRRVDELTVDFVDDLRAGSPVGYVRVTTDQGAVDREVPDSPGPHRLSTLPGLTTTVRVTVLALRPGHAGGAVALRELGIPGLAAQRALRAPADFAGDRAPVYAFGRAPQDRGACFPADGRIRCDQFLAREGEEPLGVDRFFGTPVPATYTLRLTARLRPVAGEVRSEERSDEGGPNRPPGGSSERDKRSAGGPVPVDLPVTASASSVLAGDATVAAYAAVDGDPATAWLAEPVDGAPTLRLAWGEARRVDRLRLVVPDAPVAATPRAVLVRTPAGQSAATVGADGWLTFPGVTTDRLEIEVTGSEPKNADTRGQGWPAPVGVAEVEVPALSGLLRPATPATPVTARCGSGPTVELDGVAYPTSVSSTLAEIRAGRSLPVTVCDDFTGDTVELAAGEHRLRAAPSAAFVVDSVALLPPGAGQPPPAAQRGVEVVEWHPTARTVTVAAGDAALLVVPENFNAGWRATLDGQRLRALRVDGWQQAFEVPAGRGGTVTLTFTPDRPYRVGLAAGAGAVLLVGLLALAPAGRRRRPLVAPVAGASWLIAVPVLALAVALGGVAAAVLLVAAMLVRQLRPGALPAIAFAAGAGGAVVAVVGRIQGHGQEWAYGGLVQAATLAGVCAVAATVTPSARAAPDPVLAPSLPPAPPHRATLGRSIRLFRGFLHEQSDPDRFYSMLADDSTRQLGSYVDLDGAVVLDVGGGPGYFAAAFRDAGATYVGLDPAVGDFAVAGAPVTGMIRGAGTALPVRSGSLDVCYSSNVLEHVSAPEAMLDEMVRVTRPGGTVFVSFTPWLSPWGGHETAPWHYLGGERARRRYLRREGKEPKNRYRHTLFPISAARAARWARAARRDGRVEVVAVLPRYHPRWAHWTARLPVVREFLTWNFTMILRRADTQGSHQK